MKGVIHSAIAGEPELVGKWWRRGAFDDGEIVEVPASSDWRFPWRGGHLTRFEVWACGAVYASEREAEPIARLATPLSLKPHASRVLHGLTTNDAYRIEWRDAHPNRDAAATADAFIELRRNGDVILSEGGVETLLPYEIPFPHDGFGQDDEWVRANFADADEILAAGYPDWVDGQVGSGLTNGLYKFTATFPETPPEPVQLVVGDYSVCVTNAGEFVFLLKKGVEHRFGTRPHIETVRYSHVDDIPTNGGLLRAAAMSGATGRWTIAGGDLRCVNPTSVAFGSILWMPTLTAAPSVAHLGPGDPAPVFTAVLSDCPDSVKASFAWDSSLGQSVFSSPLSDTTRLVIRDFPSWAEFVATLTAAIGTNTLVSTLCATYGKNETPQVHLSLSAPYGVFEGGALGTLSVDFSSDVPTNGTLTIICHAESGEVRFWKDRHKASAVTFPLTWDVEDFSGFDCFIEGVSVCSNLNDIALALTYEDRHGATSTVSRVMTCARVSRVLLSSEVAGASVNPPPFEGQVTHVFNVQKSPLPDQHLPVFYETVRGGEGVNDFSVEMSLEVTPSGYHEPGVRARWFALAPTPASGELVAISDRVAELRNPRLGGVYHVGAVYGGSPTNECNIVLPLAGAAVDEMMLRNLRAADNVVAMIKERFTSRERAYLKNGRKWFWNNAAGDFIGRPDNGRFPTVWCYNQVSDEDGMGAVATWGGLPIRVSKMSNFWFGYVGTKLDVPYYKLWLSQMFGTSNDESAELSWKAGRALAEGGDYGTVVSNLVRAAYDKSDAKNRRLWPNIEPLDNEVRAGTDMDVNRNFCAPRFSTFGEADLTDNDK